MRVPAKAARACGSFLLRSGTVVGAIYGSERAGVWRSPDDTTKLYENCKNRLKPKLKELKERSPVKVPTTKQMSNNFIKSYNYAVKSTFAFLLLLPENMEHVGKRAILLVQQTGKHIVEIAQEKRAAATKRAQLIAARKEAEIAAKAAAKAELENLLTESLLVVQSENHVDEEQKETAAENTENKQQLLLLTSCL